VISDRGGDLFALAGVSPCGSAPVSVVFPEAFSYATEVRPSLV
jgi:hypothetical protein